jgi:predicted neuraminidase
MLIRGRGRWNLRGMGEDGMRGMRWALALLLCMGAIAARAQSSSDGLIFPPLSSGHALPGTERYNHASTLVELKGGDLLVAWFNGLGEGDPNVVIRGARFSHGKWSDPVELARADHLACWNPVLFHTKDGRLWLYYKYGTTPRTWFGARKWSTDEGRTWSAEEKLPDGILGPIKDKPLVMSDGVIVSGSSVEKAQDTPEIGRWSAWIERSTDNGANWTKFGPITLSESMDVPDASAPATARPARTIGIIQPAVVQLKGKHLRFYARSQSKAKKIAVADSFDAGKTWSELHYIDLPNPNSGIDAVRLRDGRIVLVFNNSTTRRTPLNLAVSRDGEHFKIFKTLEDAPGQYSYPAIIQAKNGDLITSYSWRTETIKCVRIPLAEVPQN